MAWISIQSQKAKHAMPIAALIKKNRRPTTPDIIPAIIN
jgi:hypothetical protein